MEEKESTEEVDSESRTAIRDDIFKQFVIPNDDVRLKELDDELVHVAAPHRPGFTAFRQNLAGAISTAGIPWTLATASILDAHWRRIETAERIRALKLGNDCVESGESLEVARERIARKVTRERWDESLSSEDGKTLLSKQTRNFLRESMQYGLERPVRELLRQGLVLVWSAAEVLCRDTFESVLNHEPNRVKDLMRDPSTRKRFEAERLPLETIAQHGFNLSSRLGSILIGQQDFSDLPTIKATYSVLFPNSAKLRAALSSRELWTLYQRRHVIVHRAGIVDRAYIEATGEAVAEGSELAVTPAAFEAAVDAAVCAGAALACDVRG